MENTKNQAIHQQPQGSPYARQTYPHSHALTRRAPRSTLVTCPHVGTHSSPHPKSGCSPPPRWVPGRPLRAPEHSRPGCARPVAAVPDAGGGDQICGCSGGSGHSPGPSRRQSGWSLEASAPILVRRPGKLPAVLLAVPPPPPAAATRRGSFESPSQAGARPTTRSLARKFAASASQPEPCGP